LANVVGLSDRKASTKKNAIVHMIKSLHKNEPVPLYDGGQLYRDIIDLDDCVRAIDMVLTRGEVNEIYNIGNGKAVSLYDIVMDARRMLGSTSEITYVDAPNFHKIVQVKSMYMDNSKLQSLGYTPEYDTRDIIQRVIDKCE
jgi:nucleoside-diphosphate-sugar epimerase